MAPVLTLPSQLEAAATVAAAGAHRGPPNRTDPNPIEMKSSSTTTALAPTSGAQKVTSKCGWAHGDSLIYLDYYCG